MSPVLSTPGKPVSLKAFHPQANAVAVSPQHRYQIAASATEHGVFC
jgi:hypothetical protein